jgi:hypothetical protein
MSKLQRPLVWLAVFAALASLPFLSGTPAHAQGGAGAPPAAPPQDAAALGAKYFDDAIRYVARGRQGISTVQDFYVKLDARLMLDDVQQEGQMRVWWQAPDRYRQELTTNNATTTKVLAANGGWMQTPDGRVQTLGRSSEGIRAMNQLKEDRERLADVATFLAPQTLKGPGVTFLFEGFKEGSGTYAGKWIKVVRKAPGKADITFWIAWSRDPQTGEVVGTWPGIIRVQGDPGQNIPTEDFILREWDSAQSQQRAFRYPRRIQAFALLVDPQTGRTVPEPFLTAIVDDIKINAGVDATRWAMPGRGPR